MLPASAFKGKSNEFLRAFIEDCKLRIGSNPNSKEYVENQQELIKRAHRAMEFNNE